MRAALPVTAVALLAALTGCAGDSPEKEEAAAVSVPEPDPSPTPMPLDPGTGGIMELDGYCYVDDEDPGNGDKVDFTSFEAIWANGDQVTSCHLDAEYPWAYYQATANNRPYDADTHGPLMDPALADALRDAYGATKDEKELAKQLGRVATMCAMPVKGSSLGNIKDWDAAKELPTVQSLCPEHPRMAEWKDSIAAADEAEASRERHEQERRDGKSLFPGKYLVGAEAQPGRWETYAEKVTDCYWATLDAQGNIIENNFVSVAPKFEIYVPSTAAGFELSGCGMRWVGP